MFITSFYPDSVTGDSIDIYEWLQLHCQPIPSISEIGIIDQLQSVVRVSTVYYPVFSTELGSAGVFLELVFQESHVPRLLPWTFPVTKRQGEIIYVFCALPRWPHPLPSVVVADKTEINQSFSPW